MAGLCMLGSLWPVYVCAQQTSASSAVDAPAPTAISQAQAGQVSSGQASSSQPQGVPQTVVSLDEAIRRAQASDSVYINAVANRSVAAQNRTIARSALLPGASYYNQYLYTSPLRLSEIQRQHILASGQVASPVAFIANNAVHEYLSQAQVNENLGLNLFAQYKRAGAAFALATAQQEIARRGLVVSVVNGYFSVLSAAGKLEVAQRALDEANHFSSLARKLEAGREVAHADVVKADLQAQQRQRDIADAQLAAEKTRLDLGVLLFPDPRTAYTLADQLTSNAAQLPAVPPRAEIEAEARQNNPDLRAALEAVNVAEQDVSAARFGYLPTLALNYSYGIDAAQFSARGPDGINNLGYSAFGTLNIPVWDWFATQSRVKQATVQREVAKTDLSTAQRQLIASLDELYNEAQSAAQQLQSLNTSVAAAQESLKLVNLRYTAGEATALEVVDAQNTLTTTETMRADGFVRYRVALANLQTLTGKLP